MASTVAEILWLITLLKVLQIKIPHSISLFSNGMSAMHISKNLVLYERTKHIEIDYLFIRAKIIEGITKTKYMCSKEQIAKIFTKAAPFTI